MPKNELSLSLLFVVWFCAAISLQLSFPAAATGTAQFSDAAPVIELRTVLSPYHSAYGLEPDGSRWLITTAVNESARPVTRILVAEEPPDAALRLFPQRARPAIRQVATSDPDAVAVPAQAYGRHAFRVTIPAAQSISLALRLTDADAEPSVAAWNEAALAAHNRQLAVFFAAVAGLIAAALAITTGLAVMTGHAAPRFGALTLLGVLLSRLASSGLFDSIGSVNIGGPYALSATTGALTLLAGIRLADTIAPLENIWRDAAIWRDRSLMAVGALSFLTFIGVPGTMTASEVLVVLGTTAIAFYVVNCGRLGAQAARVAAPAAVVFALVVTAGAAVALGGFGANPAAPGVVGGFSSVGAVLLALAIAAGEGIAILPARRSTAAPLQPAARKVPVQEIAGANFARKAIAAARQGEFEIEFGSNCARLSADAAVLIGEPHNAVTFSVDDWVARIHPDDRDVYCQAMDDFRAQPGLAFRIEFRLAGSEEPWIWLELRAAMLGSDGAPTRCLGLLADITTRKQTEWKTAARDKLCGLRDRAALIAVLAEGGPAHAALAVVTLDIDRFKSIHASLGDEGGDLVLLETAQRLSAAFGEQVEIYRVGGDSFAFLRNIERGTVESIGTVLSDSLSPPIRVQGRDVYVSVSIGVALAGDSTVQKDLLRNAELALREAKRQGGGCLRVFSAALSQPSAPDSVSMEAEIRQALKRNELEVTFQPIMRLKDRTVAGFEALLRWQHPEKGAIDPADFVRHSERTGSIVELGKFVLEQSAAELARWQRYFPLDPPLTASVNLSRRQLQDSEFEALLKRVLSAGEIAQGTLTLELTESAVGRIDDVAERLARLKAAGAGLAIDDFGTELSGLSQLRSLPFDLLKIDKTFLARGKDGRGRARDVALLRSIVKLAQELGLVIVAEGVESALDAEMLGEMGCDFAQGFYFSAPLPRADVLAFIARHHGGAGRQGAA